MTATPSEVLEEYPLELIQGARYYRRFALRLSGTSSTDPAAVYQNFHDVNVRSQVRTKEDPVNGELILDLTTYLTVVDDTSGDGKYLDLTIPGHATAVIESISSLRKGTAFWDIFTVNIADHLLNDRLFQGPASMDYAATDMTAAEA